jgi:membrane associated rhomboid family serine protease
MGWAEVTFAAGAAGVAVSTGAAVVGAAVGVVAGVWLVHPAKQAAMNSIANSAEINPACTFLVIIIPEQL